MPDIRVMIALALAAAAVLALVIVLQFASQVRTIEVEVELSEWRIDPAVIEVRPGKIRFVVTNRGTIPHAFEIEGEIAGEEREWEIEDLQPGQTKVLEVELPPGEYEVYCPLPGHREEGMEAILTVEQAQGLY